ncbi:MAG: TIR domain-containing protein [Gammaproteobacteria bacterium]|nr:TIR domain-containing protein [Gammaproteobacteria bacterium]
MARVVFFSFDYDDVWRVNQVRNSGAFIGEKRSGFRDKAEYEQVKRRGDAAIRSWIRKQMHGCSVTCVLIGAATHRSRWVNFEIAESIANGMGLLGVYIHKLHMGKNDRGAVFDALFQPHNPLDDHSMPPKDWFEQLSPVKASDRFETHIWQPQEASFSRTNELGAWVEEAARRADR